MIDSERRMIPEAVITKAIWFAVGLVLGVLVGAAMGSKLAVSRDESNWCLDRAAHAAVSHGRAAFKSARKSVGLAGGEGIAETD